MSLSKKHRVKKALPVVAQTRWTPALLEAIALGEARVLSSMIAEGTEEAAIDAAQKAHERAAELVRTAHEREPPPKPIACKKACPSCCSAKVVATAPEVLRIAAYLRKCLDEAAFSALLARVRTAHERTYGLSRRARAEAKVACPLLDAEGSCSVHPVRPLLCAGWTSLDFAACERYWATPEGPSAPVYAIGYELTSAVLGGLAKACCDAGRDGSLLELIAALHIALERPSSAERWHKGLPVFSTARDTELSEKALSEDPSEPL